MPHNKFKAICGLSYGILMLVAVIHFEYKSAISEEMWAAIVPYISVIIFSVVFAYRNSDWYMPIDNEWPNFEYIIAPIKIILMSVIFAGFAFGIALSISQEEFRPAVLLELMGLERCTLAVYLSP
ncbi:hypothetical protein EIJ81_01310 (plasmid) [Aliivibrio salmonicida]|uniref:hypothetical protein n=1 Tax=Aliivibrio salmonicida TaxID=40269 RepID=UPI000F6D213E|nr:hypothetical protein [Aliivibrio salmonicida]AZL83531.1 hypothetical protein EIJ81_01310 [Aliivibrio salmonicida]